MASLLQTLFRRHKAGDPVCEVADTRNLNLVYSILEDIQGVGCRILKPTEAGGRGWRIVVDGKATDEVPADKLWWADPSLPGDADTDPDGDTCGEPASRSITRTDNGDPRSGNDTRHVAAYRLYGFRSAAAGNWSADQSGRDLMTLHKPHGSGYTLLQYRAIYAEIQACLHDDASVISSDHTTWMADFDASGSVLGYRRFGVYNFDDAELVLLESADGVPLVCRRAGSGEVPHLRAVSQSAILHEETQHLDDSVEEIVSANLGKILLSAVVNLLDDLIIRDSGLYAALGDGAPGIPPWQWLRIDVDGSSFDDISAAFSASLSGFVAELGVIGFDYSGASGFLDGYASSLWLLQSSVYADICADESTSASYSAWAVQYGAEQAYAMDYADTMDALAARVSALEARA